NPLNQSQCAATSGNTPRCRPGVVIAQNLNSPLPLGEGLGVREGVRSYLISHFSSTFFLKSQCPPLSSPVGRKTACACFHSALASNERFHMACDSGRTKI